MRKKLLINLCVFILICVMYFLPRFFHLDKRIGFDWDQEKLSYEVKNIIVNHKLTLIGPRANNDRGFFLGPQMTYLLIPFYLLSNLHPHALIYFIIFYNTLFLLLAYLILKNTGSPKLAFSFLALWAMNMSFIEADIAPFWPIILPLGVVGTWYFLYKLFNEPKRLAWWFLLGLTLGFFLNIHFQFVFIGMFAVAFLIFSRKKIHFSITRLGALGLGCIVMFLPLVLFDLRHNFLNVSLFFRFFTEKDPNVGHWIGAWIPVFSNISQSYLFIKNDFFTGEFFYVLIFILMFLLAKRKNGFHKYFYYSSLVLWLLFPVFFSIYGKRPSEYYFMVLNPFIVYSLADFFLTKKNNFVFGLYLLLCFSLNLFFFYPKLNSFGLNFYYKNNAVKRIKQVLGNKKCDIAFNMPRGREVGYKYLFEYYGIQTIGDWKSCVININIPPRRGDERFDYLGVTFPKELKK